MVAEGGKMITNFTIAELAVLCKLGRQTLDCKSDIRLLNDIEMKALDSAMRYMRKMVVSLLDGKEVYHA